MSVKKKIKRLNRWVEYLEEELERTRRSMKHEQWRHEKREEELENLIKFFVINQVGKHAEGGVHIDKEYIDKIKSLGVDIWYEDYNGAYVIKFKEVDNICQENI